MKPHRQPIGLRAAAATIVALLTSTAVMVGSRASIPTPVLAWGANDDRQLGPAMSASSTATPVEVSGLGHVTSVAAGVGHSLALRGDGTVWSWGRNTENELGDGDTLYSTPPPGPPDRPDPGPVYQRTEEPRPASANFRISPILGDVPRPGSAQNRHQRAFAGVGRTRERHRPSTRAQLRPPEGT